MTQFVMTVWFNLGPFYFDYESDALFGEILWKPNGESIYKWALDGLIACGDEQMTVFGPYDSYHLARSAVGSMEAVSSTEVIGFRIEPEHCYSGPYTRLRYTDG